MQIWQNPGGRLIKIKLLCKSQTFRMERGSLAGNSSCALTRIGENYRRGQYRSARRGSSLIRREREDLCVDKPVVGAGGEKTRTWRHKDMDS